MMRCTYDAVKRAKVLERGLDLADAGKVFEGFHLSRPDTKHSDGEVRVITLGMLDDELTLVVWTLRNGERRIITMWKANEKERRKYHEQRDRSG
ncbi:BrnT family toxin [Sphingomonas sp. H160509]|uniref:BrnT family toxin n=1 Tax=Sphingomonas sp. H160509 TaxID=2955313 RepID=UPI00406CCC6E